MFINQIRNANDRAVVRKDELKRHMRIYSFPNERLSSFVDLRRWMTPIEHQEDMNTCCANAFAGVCEYLIKRHSGKDIDVSRLFIYYNGQMIEQQKLRVKDDGVYQERVALGLRKYGFCEEDFWRYDKHLLNREPSENAYRKAGRYTVIPLRIPCNIEAIETCLHNQLPVLIDVRLADTTGTHIRNNGGYLTMPNINSRYLDQVASHTVVLVGYNRKTRHFIVRNSWGGDWGSQGYFHMPYGYVDDHRLVTSRDGLWTIMKIILRTDRLPSVRQLVLSHQ